MSPQPTVKSYWLRTTVLYPSYFYHRPHIWTNSGLDAPATERQA